MPRSSCAPTRRAPTQLAALTGATPGRTLTRVPLLIAADQEGGQLVGLGHGTTRFPGAMALGAADDQALTEEVGRATAAELRALGITVCYAPVCDLADSPDNVSLGTRVFGSDPTSVGRHAAAFTRGLMAGGAVATLKHFPGFGAVDVDPHYRLGVVEAGPGRPRRHASSCPSAPRSRPAPAWSCPPTWRCPP